MRSRSRRLARRETSDVDVTAFLSLIVILVPFLLITAVFSRITILELEALSSGNAADTTSSPLGLQVVVRERTIELKYGKDEPVRLQRTSSGEELASLALRVSELKARHPQSSNAIILVEPQVSYDALVQIMDVVRIRQDKRERNQESELFSNISLGSVAVVDQSGRSTP